jgi:hypothetical protein
MRRRLALAAVLVTLIVAFGCGRKEESADSGTRRPGGAKREGPTDAGSQRPSGAEREGSTDADLQRLRAGMSLPEVEAIIGKGTRYCDLDLTKVKLGFRVEDPEAQQNTYVWLRPDDDRAIVVVFEDGKLLNSMLVRHPAE